jgi:hypothetical protein
MDMTDGSSYASFVTAVNLGDYDTVNSILHSISRREAVELVNSTVRLCRQDLNHPMTSSWSAIQPLPKWTINGFQHPLSLPITWLSIWNAFASDFGSNHMQIIILLLRHEAKTLIRSPPFRIGLGQKSEKSYDWAPIPSVNAREFASELVALLPQLSKHSRIYSAFQTSAYENVSRTSTHLLALFQLLRSAANAEMNRIELLTLADRNMNLAVLLRGQQESDLIIESKSGRRFGAHKAILIARCPRLFDGRNDGRVIAIDADDQVVLTLIQCLYADDDGADGDCGISQINSIKQLLDLFRLAQQLSLTDLQRECSNELLEHLT